jgi:hypothetical protein
MTHLLGSSQAAISVSNLYSAHKLFTAKKILVPFTMLHLPACILLFRKRGPNKDLHLYCFPLTIYFVQLSH